MIVSEDLGGQQKYLDIGIISLSAACVGCCLNHDFNGKFIITLQIAHGLGPPLSRSESSLQIFDEEQVTGTNMYTGNRDLTISVLYYSSRRRFSFRVQ